LRPFRDLDLLVRAGDVPAAQRLLLTRGYRLGQSLSAARGAAYLRSNGQLPFVRSGDGCYVELHPHLLPPHFRFFSEGQRLWGRAVSVPLQGRKVATLAPEDLLLFLCVHGAKHLWARLVWVCDIAELIRTHPALDWVRVARQARRLRGERMLLLGLCLAR